MDANTGSTSFSPLQRHFGMLEQSTPERRYFVRALLEIDGDPGIARLESALRALVERYPVLQGPGGAPSLDHCTLTHAGVHGSDDPVDRLPTVDAFSSVDGVDALLARLDGGRSLLRLTAPARCADVVTLRLLARELSAASGGHPSSAGSTLAYSQVVDWQNDLLTSPDFTTGQRYWKERQPVWRSVPPAPACPVQHHATRGPLRTEVSLGTASVQLVNDRADAQGRSAESFFLAAYVALLSQTTRHSDFTVPTAFNGRMHQELMSVIGPLERYLPVRVRLEPERSFDDLWAQVAAVHREVATYQDYFTGDDGSELGGCQLPVGFEYAVWPDAWSVGAVRWRFRDLSWRLARFQTLLVVTGTADALSARWIDDSVWGGQEHATMLLAQYRSLLAAAAEDLATPVNRLHSTTPVDNDAAIHKWCYAGPAHPSDASAHRLLEQQFRLRSRECAVAAESGCLTFGELDAHANALARRLRESGVGLEVPVGIAMEGSPLLVVAALAVLKAGGVYVPLDPSYPRGRLEYMLADANVSLVVADEAWSGFVPEGRVPLLRLRPELVTPTAAESADVAVAVHPDNLAYIIYTSGSTGQPKGVQITHRGLANLMQAQTRALEIGPGDRVLQFASPSFDASIWEIFGTLYAGATLCLAARDSRRPRAELLATLTDHGITNVTLPPSALSVLPLAAVPTLRTLVCAGEPCPSALPLRWGQMRRFLNAYGPTETTVCATVGVCDGRFSPPPIGRPIANTRAYVVDAALALRPAWAIGELYVGGLGVARGYRGRPDLTAASFIPDPFSGQPGSRMYRTGDLARWLPDGELEFLGRADKQIKLRGYRIELGEIEGVLNADSRVRESAVIVHGDVSELQTLAAFVIPQRSSSPTEDASAALAVALRQALAGALPEYMVPTTINVVQQFPLLPNGKVDGRALSKFRTEAVRPLPAEPATRTEAALAGIYSQMLEREAVGPGDNFFDLGGNSLLAVVVVSRVQEVLGVDLPLRAIFDNPTVAATAAAIDALQGPSEQADAIPTAPRDVPLPLSFGQERLWFLHRLDPTSSAYNLSWALRLKGPLNLDAIERAVNSLVERHEVLRTAFPERMGRPVQIINPFEPFSIPLLDLSDATDAARETAVENAIRTNAQEPFDLLSGPVFRASLIRLNPAHHVLLLGTSHAVCDGWSLRVVARELSAVYNAVVRGEEAELAPLPIQCADHALWARQQSESRSIELLEYWRKRLEEYSGVLELPRDLPRPAVLSSRGASEPVAIPPELAVAIRTFGAEHNATPFMVTAAVFLLLISRYARTTDVAFGTPVANRTRREIEPLVGLFVNSMVLRVRIAPESSFVELVRHVRDVAIEDYAHAAMPFEALVDALQPKRDLSRSPLFQVMFGLDDAPPEPLELADLGTEWIISERQSVKVELSLDLVSRGADMTGAFAYSTDLFDAHTMRSMAAHYTSLLRHLLEAPDSPIGDVSLMQVAERGQVVAHAIGTRAPFEGPALVHQLVEAQVHATPERLAYVCGGSGLTYGEVNGKANSLATELRRLGVGPGAYVPVAMTNSLELPLTFLAVLKAGAAYVPIDPEWPANRRDAALAAVRGDVLLVNPSCEHLLPATGSPRGLVVDHTSLCATAADLDVAIGDYATIYCMFTSGSTGRPKGAVNLHRGIRNRLLFMNRYFGCSQSDVILQTCSPTFDSYMWQIFWPAINGATCVLSPDGAALDLVGTVRQIATSNATFIDMVPSVFNVLADYLETRPDFRADLRSLNHILLGGETLRTEPVRRVLSLLPRLTITSTYGPTEASIGMMFHPIDGPPEGPIPIGRPIHNTSAILLDERLNPVPHGVPGEICLGGDCVGAGYVGDDEATERVFIPNPIPDLPGPVLYRTGDLARVNRAAEFEFLGRIDDQVKISGVRVEPGEVEAALFQHPGVLNAAVQPHRDRSGAAGLIAYVVLKSDTEPTVAELREFLATRVPKIMIPAQFQVVPELPITSAGKVDRRKLPDPDGGRSEATHSADRPENHVEFQLVLIWEELLDVRSIGTSEDFFQVGGNSLMAIRMLFHIRERIGVALRVATLFDHSTIRTLAAEIRNSGPAIPWSPIVALQRQGRKPPLFFVHPIGGTVFCYMDLARRMGSDQPFFGIQAPPLHEMHEGGEHFTSLREMARSYVQLVRSIQPTGPYYLGGWSFGGTVAFEMACELDRCGESAGLVAILDTRPPALASAGFEDHDSTLAWALAWERGVITGRNLGLSNDDLLATHDRDRYAVILSKMKEAALVPPETDVETLHSYVTGYRMRSRLSTTYSPGVYGGELTLFRASEFDQQFARAGMAAPADGDFAEHWQRISALPVRIIDVPGTHATLGQEPHVSVIAAAIADCLEGAPPCCALNVPGPDGVHEAR